MTHEDIIRLGNEAERILQSEVFQEIFKEIQADWSGTWASGQARSTQEREDLFYKMQGLLAFQQALISKLDGRRVSKDQIDRANKRERTAA